MSEGRPERMRELDYFNAIGCILVMVIHILSLGITSLDPTSAQYAVIFIPHQFSAYVVPAFLFCGAVKMAAAFPAGGKYLPYIRRRFLKIYVPYLIYNVVYYLAFIPIGFVAEKSVSELIRYIVNGTLSGQFYYVLIVIQFYLLMPFWRWTVRRVPWYTGVALSLFVTILMTKADSVLALFGQSFQYFDRVFPTYLVFWVAGLYVGADYGKVREAMDRHRASFLSLAAVTAVFMVLVYLSRARQIWLYDFGFLKIFSDLAEIAFILCICRILVASGPAPVGRALKWIHSASFTVFLSHPLFLTLVTYELQVHGVTDVALMLAVRALVCFTLPFLLHIILSGIGKAARKVKLRRG